MPNTPMHIASSQGKTVSILGDRYTFKITGAETGGTYALFDFLILPGNGTPPHVHHREDEAFWILEGELTLFLGAEHKRIVAKAGEYVYAPKDVPHFFKNEGAVPVRALCQAIPAGIEHFFEQIGTPLPGPDAQPLPINPEKDIPKVIAAAPKFGIELLG
jgi:mannose-6-phosphate isomerase-like protein (cupin superfamily)